METYEQKPRPPKTTVSLDINPPNRNADGSYSDPAGEFLRPALEHVEKHILKDQQRRIDELETSVIKLKEQSEQNKRQYYVQQGEAQAYAEMVDKLLERL